MADGAHTHGGGGIGAGAVVLVLGAALVARYGHQIASGVETTVSGLIGVLLTAVIVAVVAAAALVGLLLWHGRRARRTGPPWQAEVTGTARNPAANPDGLPRRPARELPTMPAPPPLPPAVHHHYHLPGEWTEEQVQRTLRALRGRPPEHADPRADPDAGERA